MASATWTTETLSLSTVDVQCRQLSDGDCANVTCGEDGYAKDEKGCDTCNCEIAVKEKEPTKTVYQVVAAARKGMTTLIIIIIIIIIRYICRAP